MASQLTAFLLVCTCSLRSVSSSPVGKQVLPFVDVDLDNHDATQDHAISLVVALQKAVVPPEGARKNLLKSNDQQVDLRTNAPSYLRQWVNPLTVEDEDMLDKIWEKYSSQEERMNLLQLNLLLRDTDHERGEQIVTESEWQVLCKRFHRGPSEGLSKQNLISLYLEDPGSSIKRDYIRIFVEGATAPKATNVRRGNLLQKSVQRPKEASPFDAIWSKYSEGQDSMNLQQLNLLLRETDHEFGEQVLDEAEWKLLCKELGADPSQGISKKHLLEIQNFMQDLYAKNPESSITRDYIRIFVEGPPGTKVEPAIVV